MLATSKTENTGFCGQLVRSLPQETNCYKCDELREQMQTLETQILLENKS